MSPLIGLPFNDIANIVVQKIQIRKARKSHVVAAGTCMAYSAPHPQSQYNHLELFGNGSYELTGLMIDDIPYLMDELGHPYNT